MEVGVEEPLDYVRDLLLPSVDDADEHVKARIRLASTWGEHTAATRCIEMDSCCLLATSECVCTLLDSALSLIHI